MRTGEGGGFISDACSLLVQDALRGSRLRHPIFGSRIDAQEGGGRKGGEGALQRPITLFTIRTAIISWQQSEPAGFSILSARVYSPWWKKKGGTPFGQETSTKDTHNTVVAQFCGRGYAVGNMEEDFCLFAS